MLCNSFYAISGVSLSLVQQLRTSKIVDETAKLIIKVERNPLKVVFCMSFFYTFA